MSKKLVAGVVCLTAAAAVGCGGRGAGSGGLEASLPPAVEALPARAGTLPLYEELSGSVRARNQVAIRPEISAAVREVLVLNGDRVVRGQVLVRLDASTEREQLRQAEAGLQVAEATAAEARARLAEIEANVTRLRALAERGLVSDLDLETREAQLQAAAAQAAQAEAGVGQARANLAESRSELERTVVRAPVAGHVGRRSVEVGMVVSPGDMLFVLGDLDDLIVEVPLTQAMLEEVAVGTPVEVEAREVAGRSMRAEISRISPFLEQSSFSTVAEIDVPVSDRILRPGMFVAVRVLYGESEAATLVPASAVWEDARTGSQLVFVVADVDGLDEATATSEAIPEAARGVSARRVEVLAEGRGLTGIRGVDEGEWVVTLGQHLLFERLQADGAGGATPARVRPVPWARVLELQGLQREDLLEGFLAKQRRVAEAIGAELPASPAETEELLAASERGAEAAASPAATDPGR
jgi:RND family efflux transporter MFP subunit